MSKNKGGQPSKFDKINHDVVEFMYKHGATDKQVALCLKVTEQTLNNWKKAHPKFFESLKDWKYDADGKVERSLYERACGYKLIETKALMDVKAGEIRTIEIERHYPPDPTSMIFWLKNRQPKDWKDKRETTFDMGDDKDKRLVIKIEK